MREDRHTRVLLATAVALATLVAAPAWASESAGVERSLVVRDGCPTFSWAPATEAAIRLLVWRLDADAGASSKPALRKSFPAGASSWTTSRGECLAPGRYAWTVASGDDGWARPWFFDVPAKTARAGVPFAPNVFTPPACVAGQEVFDDVPFDHPFCAWIQQLSGDAVTGGCNVSPPMYCPDAAVTRSQMAVFLERVMRGTANWSPSSHSHFGQLWQGSASIGLEVSNSTGSGVVGRSASTSPGVLGSSDGIGVYGTSNDWGVYGSGTNWGVYGTATYGGVFGLGESFGVYGASNTTGVYGSGATNGVYGETTGGTGVRGLATSGAAGVFSNQNAGTAVYLADTSRAAWFTGNVHVAGTLSKSAGSFRIDHPLDPENKYLSHSFVESPDMMNVYNGNVALDRRGEAVVELPEWFEALNRDFRYQLTALGGPQPGLYVAEEVNRNRFRIGGGAPGGKVSWQVTGIRHDAYAEAHRLQVEEEKGDDERGRYLFPEGFEASKERSIGRR